MSLRYSDSTLQAAHDVILRQVPECGIESGKVVLSLLPSEDGIPAYEYFSKDGVLHVSGSTGVAICRGFYTFMKSHNYGIVTWAGKNVHWPATIPDTDHVAQKSPSKYHYNYNVVTYGYTLAFYDWERWRKEIDWMALHGYDFPLAYCGFEAIGTRVWNRFKLEQKTIDEFYVGPAFLPWQRMGNIINHDGTLTIEYHNFQVDLQHKLLDAFKELGMTPVCPGFAGFIPRGMLDLYPNIKYFRLQWCGFPEKSHATLLSPEEDLFVQIGEMYVEEYEKEFGKQLFYIADTFNEMGIPKTDDRYEWMATTAEHIYLSIRNKNPDAAWVVQGWAMSHDRNEWDQRTTKAFMSRVPNDKMLILDLATDYNTHVWHNEYGWDFYDGFYNKTWVYSVIPNMGGKSVFTGVLDYYANGHLTALSAAKKGNLVGIGMAPEGFENDEMLFELYSDSIWKTDKTNVDEWLHNYAINRYGAMPQKVTDAWVLLRKTAYNQLIDQIHYNWQFPPGTREGNACLHDDFAEACRLWVRSSLDAPEMEKSTLFQTDAIEAACHLAGIKLERIALEMIERFNSGDKEIASAYWKYFQALLLMIDNVLEAHPHFRLEEWLDSAEKMAQGKEELIKHYRESGRLLITIWGPSTYPLYDYAAKMWSGLCRDYYLNRWRVWYECKMVDKNPSQSVKEFEENWVKDSKISKALKPKDVVKACRDLVNFADSIDIKNWDIPKK